MSNLLKRDIDTESTIVTVQLKVMLTQKISCLKWTFMAFVADCVYCGF
uniref:Uncharacterized protein n=1 Tax=Tetranychus urticae TaxID=32264 RepID=T1KTZ8_TETUR